MKKLIFLFFIFSFGVNSAQKTRVFSRVADFLNSEDYELKYANLEEVKRPKKKDFEGSYHFGDGEGESSLQIIYSNGKLFARNQGLEYFESREPEFRIRRSDIEFSKGKLIHNYLNDTPIYKLYIYHGNQIDIEKGTKGLVYSFNAKENGEGEIFHCLIFNENDSSFVKFSGKYPEVSFVKLTKEELKKYTRKELKIMRNEIFARRGHIFIQGGKMDRYFSNQHWYKSLRKVEVNELSNIEQENIRLIKSIEKL